MLKLREVELFGFKSFADRTRIPLPDDLLVVVGPNGSGKSNVTDAVLWALGEQSAKTLRGHKMLDVIFGGSHKRPPAGMAEVGLLFEDADGAKTHIGRRLLRNGDSQYIMDGHPVRLKDVQDFMLRYAISTQGSFLVEQGRVEALLKASPEERRMVLEEVAGIVHYKENRRSALQKLESAEANLLRLNDVITEVETQMVALKRQAQKADRFVRLSEELRSRRRAFWGRSFGQLAGRKEALGRDLELLQKERQKRETALTQLEASLEEAKSKRNQHDSSLAALIQKIHDQDLACKDAEAEITRKTDQIIGSRNRLRQIGADVEKLGERLEGGEKERKRAEAEVHRLEKSVQKAHEDAERARAELDEGRAKVEALESAQEGLRQKAFSQAHEHARLNAELARLEENLKRGAEHERRLERERERLVESERALGRQREEAEARTGELDERLDAFKGKRSEADSEAARLGEQVVSAAATLASAREALAVSEGRVSLLKEHEAAVRSTAHAYLKEHAPDRVGQTLAEALSGVPEALVAPLASLLGDLLEGYLEAKWDDLPATLAVLAREKAGQALFFLSQAGPKKSAPAVSGRKGFVGWIHEADGLPDSLRNVLPLAALAESAAAAHDIAYALSVPAVSRDGVLVHPAGYVRGGAGGVGGASLLDHEREARDAERGVQAARKSAEKASADLEALKSALKEAQTLAAALKADEDSAREAFASAARDLEALEGERTRIAASKEVLEGEALQASEERNGLEAQKSDLAKLALASDKERSVLDGQMKEGEQLLATARRAQEEAHERVAETREAASKLVQQEKSAQSAAEKSAGYLEQLRDQERRLGEEAASLEGRAASLSAEVTEGQKGIGAMLLALEEDRRRKATFEEDLRRYAQDVEGIERHVREAREALDEVRGEVGRAEITLTTVGADLRNLSERMAETFEEAPEDLAREFSNREPLSEEERQEEAKALIRLEGRIQELGAVNMLARQEYTELEQRFQFLTTQRKDLEESVGSLQETIRKINRTTRERFMEAFNAVQDHFAHLFKEVFEGGEARLTLLDEANPLETGVEIYAQPPGKKLQNMLALSGGEKAMVALALLFALFMYRPQPFFLLDEVDAPLDEANINRFSRLLLRFQGQTQFIVVSHNKRTMELAEVLYGVTMAEGGVSKMVSVRLADVEEQLLAEG